MNFYFTLYSTKNAHPFFLCLISFLSFGYTYAQSDWIGPSPSELIPGARPLGSLQVGKYESKRPARPVEQAIDTKAPSLKAQPKQEPIAPPPQPRDFSEFHSNLGRQPIVEKLPQASKNWIGVTPNELLPRSKLLGSMKNRSYQSFNALNEPSGAPVENITTKPNQETLPLELSLFASTRPYFTTNVLRTKEDEVESAVWENTIGASLASKPIPTGQYITLVPKLDFLMQWANYNEDSISDLLNYRFGMVKGTLDIYLPHDFRISPGIEYDFLHSQFSGDKLFDAVAPSLSVQKVFGINESTFLMLDGLLKYSSTNRVITFDSDDIFPDDGDNLQVGLNLNLMKSFGPDGQFIIMPGLGISRTQYLKNNQNGRVDMVYFAGLSGIWQPLQWLSFQTFGNFSAMNTNGKGETLLGKSSKFQAWDIGASVTASHTF
jgi:hypothetical protein